MTNNLPATFCMYWYLYSRYVQPVHKNCFFVANVSAAPSTRHNNNHRYVKHTQYIAVAYSVHTTERTRSCSHLHACLDMHSNEASSLWRAGSDADKDRHWDHNENTACLASMAVHWSQREHCLSRIHGDAPIATRTQHVSHPWRYTDRNRNTTCLASMAVHWGKWRLLPIVRIVQNGSIHIFEE